VSGFERPEQDLKKEGGGRAGRKKEVANEGKKSVVVKPAHGEPVEDGKRRKFQPLLVTVNSLPCGSGKRHDNAIDRSKHFLNRPLWKKHCTHGQLLERRFGDEEGVCKGQGPEKTPPSELHGFSKVREFRRKVQDRSQKNGQPVEERHVPMRIRGKIRRRIGKSNILGRERTDGEGENHESALLGLQTVNWKGGRSQQGKKGKGNRKRKVH